MSQWNLESIHREIEQQLKKVRKLDEGQPLDHAGGTVPISLALLAVLQLVSNGAFHGTLELSLKGSEALNPRLTKRTYRLVDTHSKYLKETVGPCENP